MYCFLHGTPVKLIWPEFCITARTGASTTAVRVGMLWWSKFAPKMATFRRWVFSSYEGWWNLYLYFCKFQAGWWWNFTATLRLLSLSSDCTLWNICYTIMEGLTNSFPFHLPVLSWNTCYTVMEGKQLFLSFDCTLWSFCCTIKEGLTAFVFMHLYFVWNFCCGG